MPVRPARKAAEAKEEGRGDRRAGHGKDKPPKGGRNAKGRGRSR